MSITETADANKIDEQALSTRQIVRICALR